MIRWPASNSNSTPSGQQYDSLKAKDWTIACKAMTCIRKSTAVDEKVKRGSPMLEWKRPAIDDLHNLVQQSDQAEVTRASIRNQNTESELDRRLDQALVETFPASDSIAIIIC